MGKRNIKLLVENVYILNKGVWLTVGAGFVVFCKIRIMKFNLNFPKSKQIFSEI